MKIARTAGAASRSPRSGCSSSCQAAKWVTGAHHRRAQRLAIDAVERLDQIAAEVEQTQIELVEDVNGRLTGAVAHLPGHAPAAREHDAQQRPVALEVVEEGVDQEAEVLLGAGAGVESRFDLITQPQRRLAHDLAVDRLLAVEHGVERSEGDLGASRDLTDLRVVVTARGERLGSPPRAGRPRRCSSSRSRRASRRRG